LKEKKDATNLFVTFNIGWDPTELEIYSLDQVIIYEDKDEHRMILNDDPDIICIEREGFQTVDLNWRKIYRFIVT